MDKHIARIFLLSCCFFVTAAHADLFVKVKNTDTSHRFADLKIHANIADLTIPLCSYYSQEEIKKDPSIQMSCAHQPDDTIFVHHISSQRTPSNGKARIYISFEERPQLTCYSTVLPLIDGTNEFSLKFPRDFTCK
jgi:hypothetical protein